MQEVEAIFVPKDYFCPTYVDHLWTDTVPQTYSSISMCQMSSCRNLIYVVFWKAFPELNLFLLPFNYIPRVIFTLKVTFLLSANSFHLLCIIFLPIELLILFDFVDIYTPMQESHVNITNNQWWFLYIYKVCGFQFQLWNGEN